MEAAPKAAVEAVDSLPEYRDMSNLYIESEIVASFVADVGRPEDTRAYYLVVYNSELVRLPVDAVVPVVVDAVVYANPGGWSGEWEARWVYMNSGSCLEYSMGEEKNRSSYTCKSYTSTHTEVPNSAEDIACMGRNSPAMEYMVWVDDVDRERYPSYGMYSNRRRTGFEEDWTAVAVDEKGASYPMGRASRREA